jgi:branched-chain amino acid transport system ATP-binding protein
MSILALDNLHKQYGALSVTQDFSLEVKSGEIVGILGPNGAGKTTLFNLITGTVSPNSGRIILDGRDVTALDPSQRCRLGVSRSFQVPHPFVGMTVFENILVGATFGRGGGNAEKRALDVMRLTGMWARANTRAGALTLLERKRLELARALAADPRLLLLDEIAGGLTDNECVSLLDAIRDIHSTGVTIIWIEHVVHALISVAQRLVVMDFGRKVIDGEPGEVMASREVQAIYMGEEDHG